MFKAHHSPLFWGELCAISAYSTVFPKHGILENRDSVFFIRHCLHHVVGPLDEVSCLKQMSGSCLLNVAQRGIAKGGIQYSGTTAPCFQLRWTRSEGSLSSKANAGQLPEGIYPILASASKVPQVPAAVLLIFLCLLIKVNLGHEKIQG